jgi:hypothetical protein
MVSSSSLLTILRASPACMQYSLVPVPDMFSAHLWGDGIFLQPPGNPSGYSSLHSVLTGPCTRQVFCPPVGRRYLPPASWQSSGLLRPAFRTPRSLYLTCFCPSCGETVSSSSLLAILRATLARMQYSPFPVPDMFLPTCGETVSSSSLLAILRATPACMQYSAVPVPDMFSAHLWGRRYLPPASWQSSGLLRPAFSAPRSLYLTCFLPTCGGDGIFL